MLRRSKRVLVSSHDNPDPDSIASALLLEALIRRKFGVAVTVGYGGVIGRAENNALLAYAQATFRRLDELDWGRFDTKALVDTQPGAGNHRFANADDIRVVFDHHRLRPQTRSVPFYDVRTRIGATTTLLYSYWKAAGMRITKRYATLMFYALRSETAEMGRKASSLDRESYRELYASADLGALSRITGAKVGRDYFATVHRGIERSTLHGPVVVTRLGRMPYPDVVAEIAEYFLKYEGGAYAFAIGRYRGEVLLSLRSDDPDARLGRTAQDIVRGLGTAGGHGSAAGGQIDVRNRSAAEIERIETTVIRRLLEALGQRATRGKRLLRKTPVR